MPTPDPDDDPIAPVPGRPVIHVPHELRVQPMVADAPHPVSLTTPAPAPETPAPPPIAPVAGAAVAPAGVELAKSPPENLPAPGSKPAPAPGAFQAEIDQEPPAPPPTPPPPPSHAPPTPFQAALSALNAEGRGDMSLREAVAKLASEGHEIPDELAQLLK